MKLLISLILFIFLNNHYVLSTIVESIYISNNNGLDSELCGKTIESPCKTIQGSLSSLENQFNKTTTFPTYYQTTFYFDPSTYTTTSTINMDGYNAIFQPYPNVNGNVYFNGYGNGISPTWFTSTLNNNLALTFINISSTDCRVSNGFSSFLIETNTYNTPTVLINFNNCNFYCQNGINAPIILVSNGTTAVQDYSSLSDKYQINFNGCTFGSSVVNTTLINPFINTNIPLTLSLDSCNFNNLVSTTNESLINFNNGIISIENTQFYSMVQLFILQSNNSMITIDTITDNDSGSKYDNGMLNVTNSLFSFINFNLDVSINNGLSLISIVNSFGSFEGSSISTDDFIFNKNVNISYCRSSYLINSENSNIFFTGNYLNGCGPALLVSSSIITANNNKFPYIITPAMECNKNTVSTFIGSDVSDNFNIDGCTGSGANKVGFIVGIVILSAVIAILLIVIILLFRKRHYHHHHSYTSIH